MSDDSWWDEDWRSYRCSDCDPEIAKESGEEPEFQRACIVLVREDDEPPKHCPQCESYLSMCEDESELHITNTLFHRWAAKQKAKVE